MGFGTFTETDLEAWVTERTAPLLGSPDVPKPLGATLPAGELAWTDGYVDLPEGRFYSLLESAGPWVRGTDLRSAGGWPGEMAETRYGKLFWSPVEHWYCSPSCSRYMKPEPGSPRLSQSLYTPTVGRVDTASGQYLLWVSRVPRTISWIRADDPGLQPYSGHPPSG